MSSGIGLPVIFPTSGSTSRRLASLHRVPWVGSPASSVRSRRYDSLTSFPPRFVSFAWRYRDLPHRFAPARGWDSYAHRPGLFSRSPKPLLLTHGDVRASQVPGWTPVCGRPARGPRTGPLRQAITAQECCRRPSETRRPNRFASFRGSVTQLPQSLSTLRGLRYRRARARLASGWWPTFAGQDSHLPGSLQKVSLSRILRPLHFPLLQV